jgi:hypothetical protein
MDEIIKQIYPRRIYQADRAQQDDRSPSALRLLIYFEFEVFLTFIRVCAMARSEFLIEARSVNAMQQAYAYGRYSASGIESIRNR